MTGNPDETDVVVVGGGLAGLAAARRLHRAGVTWQLVEAADRLGGRVASDRVDGFLVDRGFQVLNTDYPRLTRLLDPDILEMRWFSPGALVRRGGSLHKLAHPLRQPLSGPGSVFAGVGTLTDRLRLAALGARCALTPPRQLLGEPETTAMVALRQAGLSERIIEEFLRPFLAGVLADRDLDTSSHVLAMIMRSFARGRIGVPAAGMGALGPAVAGPLPNAQIRLNTTVSAVGPGRVVTADGELRCRAVLVATDPPTAARLLPKLGSVRMRSLTTYYHVATETPVHEPILVLDGDRREVVTSSMVISRAAPTYAPAGRHLIASTVVGPHPPPEPVVRAEVARLYGETAIDWEHLTTVSVPYALPAAPPPQGRLRKPVSLGDNVFVAGDHRDSPSIQGALASGWRAAGRIIESLRAAEPGVADTEVGAAGTERERSVG